MQSALWKITEWILLFYEKGSGLLLELPGARWIPGRPRLWQIACYYGVLLFYLWRKRKEKKEGRQTGKQVVRQFVTAGILLILLGIPKWKRGQMELTMLDVGQGESVILTSGGETALVDCGSSNSYKVPGGLAADTLHSMGVRELSAVVVTHYHADHTNGLYEVLRRIPVQTIYLPDIEDEYGVRERLVSLAEEKGAQVTYVTKETADTLGDTVLTIYPPVQSGGDLNELGLTALASAGDFDLLITGDMSGSTEKKLVETYALPNIEVLVVSHHGSRYSSNIRFLKAVTPEAAVISVGDNNYGHPSEETLQRLLAVGADIWRTDQQGTIRITVNGG